MQLTSSSGLLSLGSAAGIIMEPLRAGLSNSGKYIGKSSSCELRRRASAACTSAAAVLVRAILDVVPALILRAVHAILGTLWEVSL